MMISLRLPAFLALAAVPLLVGAPAAARAGAELAPPDALEAWMPADFAGYLKLQGLGERLESFLRSEGRRDLEALPVVKFLLSQEPWRKFQDGLDEFPTSSGKEPLQAFRDLLGLEVVIAHRPQDGETLFLTRAAGEKELEGALQAVRQAVSKKAGFNLEGYRSSHGELSTMPASAGFRSCAHSGATRPPVECPVRITWSWPSRSRTRSIAASISSKYCRRSVTKLGVWCGRNERPYLRRSSA